MLENYNKSNHITPHTQLTLSLCDILESQKHGQVNHWFSSQMH